MTPIRTACVAALAACVVPAANAQVTLYGNVETSLRVQSNSNASASSLKSLTPGGYGSSRVGFRGREDLGGGLYASFHLAQSINPDTGMPLNPTRGFNAHSWVGLGGDWGNVTAGRQYTLAHEVLGMRMYDPLGVGGYDETAWYVGSHYTLRNDNSIKYRHNINGVEVGLMYALSETQGVGGSYGAMFIAPVGRLSVSFTHMADKAVSGRRTTNVGVLKYELSGGTTLHAYMMQSDDRRGVNRKDRLYSLGVIHPFTPKITLSGVLYRDLATTPAAGARSVAAMRAQYALSKRTELYLEADHSRVSGVTVAAFNDPGKAEINSRRSTVSLGIKHAF